VTDDAVRKKLYNRVNRWFLFKRDHPFATSIVLNARPASRIKPVLSRVEGHPVSRIRRQACCGEDPEKISLEN